jgi:FkbM family methyltransferase
MTRWIQRILARFGLEVKRLPSRHFPYIARHRTPSFEFDFWIVNERARAWYDAPDRDHVPEIAELMRMAEEGDVILEVGAEYGFFTMVLASRVGSRGRVVAVEPHPQSFMVLQAQVQMNGFCDRIRTVNAAFSDAEGTLWISESGKRPWMAKVPDGTKVRAMRGDSLELPGPVTFLKIDVEGHELRVLRGCREILKNRPKLALELHCPFMADPRAELDRIFDLIGLESRTGTMIIRKPGAGVTVPFVRDAIPLDCVTNIFLTVA